MININDLQLLPFTMEDYTTFISWITDARFLSQFAGKRLSYPVDEIQLDKFYSDPNRFPYKLIDSRNDQTIGHAELLITADTVRIGQVLIADEQQRGHGIGKALMHLLLDKSFTKWDKEIVELNVYDWNKAAIACYEKVGFKFNPDKHKETKVEKELWLTLNMRLTRTAYLNNNCF